MSLDLRKHPVDDLLRLVEHRLALELDRSTLVRKRRTLGAASNRRSWVRIEARPLERIQRHHQPGDGLEASAFLEGVAKPLWLAAVTWVDEAAEVVWRADETEYAEGHPIRQGASLDQGAALSDGWWAMFNNSLDVLAGQQTTRIATPDLELMSQELVTATVSKVFPEVDTDLGDEEWLPAHADLNWSNLLAPDCVLIDWEDFGLAPRGLDAATLWVSSLVLPELAERVHHERQADLDCRSGQLMALFHCCKILGDSSATEDPVYPVVRTVADELAIELSEECTKSS